MNLRNKKTGEIVEITMPITNGDGWNIKANSLSELCEEWEDYEEPKGYWYIRDGGNIDYSPKDFSITKRHKEIGNYFETEEEAEKAVEKLKAWKRLKDKGFRFAHYDWTKELTVSDMHIYADIDYEWSDLIEEDLQTVFGGEE